MDGDLMGRPYWCECGHNADDHPCGTACDRCGQLNCSDLEVTRCYTPSPESTTTRAAAAVKYISAVAFVLIATSASAQTPILRGSVCQDKRNGMPTFHADLTDCAQRQEVELAPVQFTYDCEWLRNIPSCDPPDVLVHRLGFGPFAVPMRLAGVSTYQGQSRWMWAKATHIPCSAHMDGAAYERACESALTEVIAVTRPFVRIEKP